jgi:hypothetical protein
VALLLI